MILQTIGKEYYSNIKYPLKVYGNLNYIPDIPLGEAYQIVIIEEGTGIIKLNQERIIIHAPVVFLLNELDSIISEESSKLLVHILYFHPNIVDSELDFQYVRKHIGLDYVDFKDFDLYLLNSFLIRDMIYSSHYQMPQTMLRRLVYLKECISVEYNNQGTSSWPCKGRTYFLEMLCYLSNINTEAFHLIEAVLNSTNELYDKILLYIYMNYSEKITLQHIVDVFNVNRTTLNKIFKGIAGETITSYIIKLRIEISILFLKDSKLPVKEIAYRVGFDDVVHYFRTFKKIIGCTPNQYRENKHNRSYLY